MDDLLFELLQCALGVRHKLSRNPSDDEWISLYKKAQEQALAGVLMQGLEALSQMGQKPPQPLLYEWIGVSEQIRHRNQELNARCKELLLLFHKRNVRSSILKGQGIARLYDVTDKEKGCEYDMSELRQSGDIDIYVDIPRGRAVSISEELTGDKVHWDYKHLHLEIWDDVEIEVHYKVEILFNLFRNRKLQRWFKRNENLLFSEEHEIISPCTQFNVFYILLHTYRHFLHGGIGLRQIMDYYFVLLRSDGRFDNYVDGESLTKILKEFGLYRFACGLMWVLQKTMGLENRLMICNPIESEGKYILMEVMKGGNFGHYDKRMYHGGGKLRYVLNVCKHSFHLLRYYPKDAIWVPIWLVWHKMWKITHF